MVYHCSEIDHQGQLLGPRLVAKQTRFEELMHANDFHTAFCRVQGEAQALATLFNRRVRGLAGPRSWVVSFLDCVVYHVKDARYPGGKVKFLAEQALPLPVLQRCRPPFFL
jgi:hypothetical protein